MNKNKKGVCHSGRSMVEMLGVLAIIGVLSVGAITGYSKAMTKYKLNKHAEAFNIFLNNIIIYVPQFECTQSISYYGDMLKSLNLIPDAFMYRSYTDIYDNFSNRMWVFGYCADAWASLGIRLPVTSLGEKICQNFVQTAKENAGLLRKIVMQVFQKDVEKSYYEEAYYGDIWGDSYCMGSRKCLRDLTLNDVSKLCQVCVADKMCTLYISYPRY